MKAEFSAEEEDSGAVVLEGAEGACVGLDCLDFTIESLGDSVGDRVAQASQDVFKIWLSLRVTRQWHKTGSHGHEAAEHPSWIADALQVSPLDDLEFNIIILVGLKLPIRMVGVSYGIPVPKGQPENRMPDRLGIRQVPGKFIQMGKAEQLH